MEEPVSTDPPLPLAGIVAVELGASVAGPWCGMVLAELGAEVIKIENPENGDDTRAWAPPYLDKASAIFQTLNRNKRSAAVDLGPANVNVNAVAPGFVRTERLEQLPPEVIERAKKGAVLGRIAEAADVAQVVSFLCSEAARHITGQVVVVDGGLSLV